MTIKNHGGIFGRNPTFNEVDIDGQLSVDNGTLHVDPINNRVGINTTSPDEDLHIVSATPRIKFVDTGASAGVYNLIDCNGASGRLMLKVDDGDGVINSYIGFHVDGSEVGRWNSDGNLVIANAGNGIDFSATAGTGTSELFDDYEEGTWTATLFDANSGGNASPTTATGYYTKIGRVVNCIVSQFTNVDTSGMSGTLRMSLPFTPSSGGFYSSGTASMAAGTFPANTYVLFVSVYHGEARAYLQAQGTNGAAPIGTTNITSGTTDLDQMTFSYIAA